MSAAVQWSIVRNSAKYIKKQNGTAFSWNSVDNLHKASTAVGARNRSVNVIKGKLHKTEAGKTTVHRVTKKRVAKLVNGFRGDAAAAIVKKARFQKRAASKKAGDIATKKNVKA